MSKIGTTVEVLRQLRDDVKAMEFETVGEDGHTILIAKTDVLDIIQDYIEYVLAPNEAA